MRWDAVGENSSHADVSNRGLGGCGRIVMSGLK